MRPIFDYLEYRDILKDAFEEHKAAMPLFSYRMLGDRLGLDGSYTFRIIHKDLHLPGRCIPQAIEFLGLKGRNAEYFQLIVAYQREKKSKARQEILDKALSLRDVVRSHLHDQTLAFFQDWWVVAIHCLIDVTGGRANPKELAARLCPTVPEEDVKKALDLLLDLGLVKKGPSGRLLISQTHLTALGDEKSRAVRAFQKQILAMAQESIDRFPRGTRDISTLTVAIDETASTEIREMLRECRRQVQKRVEDVTRPDRVMQIAMAAFPLAPAPETT
ncbi:MAG: TIGR02147 family protein [Fibrobacteria bacterium]|nr:TIGR02147 family protein [Fibrobacteria bacterium]